MISASPDLSYQISKLCQDIILLQGTWLSPSKSFTVRNFRSFRLDRQGRGGGLLTLVSTAFCHKASISFTLSSSELEILGVDICLPNYILYTVTYAYFPSGVASTKPLDAALASCKPHSVLVGDFNSLNVSWGFAHGCMR